MKICILFFSFLFSFSALANTTALELARGYNAVTFWAVGENIELSRIDYADEHYYDGDLDGIDYVVYYSKSIVGKTVFCSLNVYVDYPYIPQVSTYKKSGPAKVDYTEDENCSQSITDIWNF